MAAKEGRKIANRTDMVYDTDRVSRKPDEPTYIRPTAADHTVDLDHPLEGFTVGNLADGKLVTNPLRDEQSEIGDANRVDTAPVAEVPHFMQFNAEDFDVGPLAEFYQPVTEPAADAHTHRDASVPCTPHAPVSSNETRSTAQSERSYRERSPTPHPAQRSLMEHYGGEDSALTTKNYAMNITVKKALRSRGAEAERVILKELSQMINKKVWTPVYMSALSSTEKGGIIRSQMFLKEKYLPSGHFEKLKARLVAGGNQQDKDLYDDLSSPTVSTSVVMTVFAIAAYEKRSAAVVDIGGAFLNADMNTGIKVYMRLDRTLSKMLIKLDGRYDKYCDAKGNIVVRLDKALYGCVESVALWYENLSETLRKAGFIENECEICVYNKWAYGLQCTIAVHVDDSIITSVDQQMIEDICSSLNERYGNITRQDGPILNYLGMVFGGRGRFLNANSYHVYCHCYTVIITAV